MLKTAIFASFATLTLAAAPAISAPVLSSSANAASVNLKVGNIVAADLALAPVSGTAAPSYSHSGSLASINAGAHLFGTLLSVDAGVTSGIVSTLAEASYPNTATGSANIANARAGLYTTVLGAIPLAALGVSADVLSSTTVAGINEFGLYASGTSSIANLVLAGSIFDTLGLNLGVYSNPLANTHALSVAGLNIFLNEQLTDQTADSISMTTNAVRISLNDYLFQGRLLTGDIILGQSKASVTGYQAPAVPEPTTWAMLIAGMALVGMMMRRSKTSVSFA